jgi:hypothetical protein
MTTAVRRKEKLFPHLLRRTVQAISEGLLCESFPDAW